MRIYYFHNSSSPLNRVLCNWTDPLTGDAANTLSKSPFAVSNATFNSPFASSNSPFVLLS